MQDILFFGFITLAFAAVFAVFWIGIVYLISRLSGWKRLSREFPATGRIEGSVHRFCSARLKFATNYSNCLTVTVSPAGIHMLPMKAFQFGHSAILIPWDAVLDHQPGAFPIFRSMNLTIQRRGSGGASTIILYGRSLVDALSNELDGS